MAYCTHKMPLIGQLRPGLWVASAFGGHGLNTTAMAGMLIDSAISEGDDRWRLFESYGMGRGVPLARRSAVQLAYWMMQIRDYVEEKR